MITLVSVTFVDAVEQLCLLDNTLVFRLQSGRHHVFVVNSCFPRRKEKKRWGKHDEALRLLCRALHAAGPGATLLLAMDRHWPCGEETSSYWPDAHCSLAIRTFPRGRLSSITSFLPSGRKSSRRSTRRGTE